MPTVLDGLVATKQATDRISGIANDSALMNLLQEVFRGYETDLSSLAATLSWSESVVGNMRFWCSPLYSLLLSSQAQPNLCWAKDTLQEITDLRDKLKTTVNRLIEFGSFNWDQWSSYGRDQSKDEFATRHLKRMQVAAHNMSSVLSWSKYNAQRLNCQNSGLADFVYAVEQKKLPTSLCGEAFEFVTYRSIGRSIYKSFPELEGFSGADHEKKRADTPGSTRKLLA